MRLSLLLPCSTHHCDVEGIEQVKGQGSYQVHKEPRFHIVNADGPWLINHLARLANIGGAEVQDNVCKCKGWR